MMRLSGLLLLMVMSAPAMAQEQPAQLSIAAIVNDSVISSLDYQERMRLVLGLSGRADDPRAQQLAKKQVMQTLVDETLKLQEAKRYNIVISDADISEAQGRIEQAQGRKPGTLEAFVAQQGLPVESFRKQLEGEVAWSKLVSRVVRRNVRVSDDEVLRAQQRLAAGKKVEELQIASIVFPVANPADVETISGIARDVRSQLIAGADAQSLLSEYQQRTPLEFGPLTWVQREMVHADIGNALQKIEVGGITPPVMTPSGIQLVRLMDKRSFSNAPQSNAEVALKQIVLRLDDSVTDYEIKVMMDVAKQLREYPGSCTQQGIGGVENFEGLEIDVNYVRTTLMNMSADVRPLVEPLRVTQVSEPFAAPDGIHMLMLCERIDMPAALPDREEVKQLVFQEKLALEAEKYLRRLRREALIDVRL